MADMNYDIMRLSCTLSNLNLGLELMMYNHDLALQAEERMLPSRERALLAGLPTNACLGVSTAALMPPLTTVVLLSAAQRPPTGTNSYDLDRGHGVAKNSY